MTQLSSPQNGERIRPIHLAAMHNRKGALKVMLDAGIDPWQTLDSGDTVLHSICKEGAHQSFS